MLDAHDPDAAFGPLFVVDSVEAFHAARPETLTVIEELTEIPGGFMATYQDPGGSTIYVMDQSTDQNAP
jgi:predicted enzyme related to lactoylglutathione lyase